MESQLYRVVEQRRKPLARRRWRPGRAVMVLLGLAVIVAGPAAGAPPAPPRAKVLLAAGATPDEPWDGRFLTSPAAELAAAGAVADTLPRSGDAPVLQLFAEVIHSFDAAGRLSSTYRLVYRVRTAEADARWSQVGVSWLPWHQEAPRIRARVVTADGQEHPFDLAACERGALGSGEAETYSERQLLRCPLPAVGPGAVVEEEETVVDSAPAFDRGIFVRQQLERAAPVRHERIVLEAPAGLPLRWSVEQLPGLAPTREVKAGRQRLTFEIRDLPALSLPPPGLPPEAPRTPAIAFSDGATWGEIGESYSRIVDRAIAEPGDGTAPGSSFAAWLQATGAHQASGSQLETIGRVLARLADIRYAAVELGESSFLPRSPAETLRRRFGDCKDKSVLLVAALRALEIPAYVALLAAGEEERDVDPELPGFSAFDHAIVYVPGNPAIWIDPTNPYARAGELPTADQGRLALVAAPGVAALARTPRSTAAENRMVVQVEFFLAESGPARAVETVEYSGAVERNRRAYLAESPKEAQSKHLDGYVQAIFKAKSAASVESSDPHDLSRPLTLRLEVRGAERGFTDAAAAAVAIFYDPLLELLPDDLTAEAKEHEAERHQDYWFEEPYTAEIHFRVVPPPGFEPEELPASQVRRLGPASLSEEYSAGTAGVTTATLRFESGKQRLTPAELASLREAIGKLVKERFRPLRFRQRGEWLAAAGRIGEALEEFRRESAEAPGKALPHERMARALLAGGLGEAARQEAERAAALEPRSAAAQSTLGWVLQHDVIGRRFGPGYPREQARAAYLKAKQLDPSLRAARIDYAALLEHDAIGTLYVPGPDLIAAISEYQSLRRDLEDETLDEALLTDLVYAGRTAEAIELAGTMKDTDIKTAATAAAIAMKDGVEAAVREVERTAPDPTRRATALALVGSMLVRLHAFAEAATLIERSRPGSSDASMFAAILRQARRLNQIPLPANEPTSVARRALIAVWLGRPEDFLNLFSEHLFHGARPRPQLVQQWGEMWAAVSRQAGRTALLSADTKAEIVLAAMKESSRGDDLTGYRIDYHLMIADADFQFFVVRERGGYRIAAMGFLPASLGLEALRRLDAGDLHGARQWLDWARELTGEPAGDFPSPAFSALWTPGVADDAQQARCAAAALVATLREDAAAAVPVLRGCRAAAESEQRQLALDLALADAASALERWEDVIEVARRLSAARPQSGRPFGILAGGLSHLGRTDDVLKLARQRLERLPEDRLALLVLFRAEQGLGHFEQAERPLRQLVERTGAGAEELNGLAWLQLLRGRVDEAAIELAQRATQRPEGQTPAVFHTLGALLAERNRPAEAYQAMLRAVVAEPAPSDWYVFGRMAEQYGLPETARGLYARVERDQKDDAASTWRLAQARLASLSGAASAAAVRVRP